MDGQESGRERFALLRVEGVRIIGRAERVDRVEG